MQTLPTTLQQASSTAGLPVEHFFGPLHEAVLSDPEFAERRNAAASGLGCVRGIRYAIALEGAVAVALYGLWHLWHALR